MKCICVLIFGIISRTLGENVSVACCPSGKVVNYRMSMCWVPATNDTTPLQIQCKPLLRTTQFKINAEGLVDILNENVQLEPIERSRACVGTEMNKNRTASRNIALLCGDQEEPAMIDDRILGYCMIVSAVFLTFTAIIYAVFEELRDLHGKSVINLCASLAIGLAILSIMKLMQYSDMNLCATRGFLAYFFLITAFFWTSSISIQLLKSMRQPFIVDRGWKEFAWYALYAYGCPTLLTIIMAIINFHPGNHSKPGIGLNHCWFLNRRQQWIYMYSVMSILLSINILIFIYAATIVWRHTFSSGHIRALRYRLSMTIRLIIVLGLFWIFEMVGSLAPDHIVWAIMDVVNTLQGPLIFLVLVVFRKRAIKAMLKHGWLDCVSGPVEKHLAAGSDVEDDVIQHTDIPMNGRVKP